MCNCKQDKKRQTALPLLRVPVTVCQYSAALFPLTVNFSFSNPLNSSALWFFPPNVLCSENPWRISSCSWGQLGFKIGMILSPCAPDQHIGWDYLVLSMSAERASKQQALIFPTNFTFTFGKLLNQDWFSSPNLLFISKLFIFNWYSEEVWFCAIFLIQSELH